jgi:methyl-accepting chemotaxis protein
MFLAALGLISILMRRFLLKPIKIIHRTIRNIEKNSDLNQQIPVTSNDELGATTNALNRMLIQFRDTMSEVVTATSSLDSASQSIDSSSNQALDAAVAQRDKTNHINDQIQQLKHSIDVVKNNTDTSSQASDQAMQVSQQGTQKTQQAINGINSMTEAIDQAVKVINNLDERSTNVGSVLDVIKGIAEQTNLLALNAAIEAARAGESGRGFAVVADEVRSLAIKTHESTQEIEEMIGQLQSEAQGAVGAMDTAQEKANEGVEQVQQASQALAEMANQVEHMNSLNHETLQAVDAQVSIGNQVEAGIENIAGHADNSAGMAQHNADVAHQLVTLSGNLNKLVQRFRI